MGKPALFGGLDETRAGQFMRKRVGHIGYESLHGGQPRPWLVQCRIEIEAPIDFQLKRMTPLLWPAVALDQIVAGIGMILRRQ